VKCLARDKTPFWYCLFLEKTAITTTGGYETGEYKNTYGTAVKCLGNVSQPSGTAQVEMFGNFADYDKVIIVDDMSCPITENTVLFVDIEPTYDSGNPRFDYIVKRVAKSKNSGISYAVKKVR